MTSPARCVGPDQTGEGKLRKEFIDTSVAAIRNAVTPASENYMNFNDGGQPLVDAAFRSRTDGIDRPPRLTLKPG